VNLSADAILLGLRLMEARSLDAAELAGHLRAVGQSEADQLVALEERVIGQDPTRAELVSRLAAQAAFVPADCPGCRGRFRIRPEGLRADSPCPLCGEPMAAGRRLLFLTERSAELRRAAEGAPPYETARPRRLGHFELGRLLGRGGAGRVYEARNLQAARTVALKVLDFQPLESAADAMRRLRREARVASAIVHENIVRVFDLGVAEGLSYIEMELVPGASLRERVRREGPPPVGEAVRICGEALAGLARLHERDIVHRDVKPSNVLLDEGGRARLTDFGIARFLEETTSLGSADRLVGSPHFMAPEQWRGEPVSPRTDVYAMGLVLYFALSGHLPYEGRGLAALMYGHLHEPLLEPAAGYPLPERFCAVIRRAIEKRPEARFADAEEFRHALVGN
jgi:serine/threonine protein kinase